MQVGRHRSLTSLDLSGNLLLPEGGKALALHLNFPARSSLTRLDVSDNHLGKKASHTETCGVCIYLGG